MDHVQNLNYRPYEAIKQIYYPIFSKACLNFMKDVVRIVNF